MRVKFDELPRGIRERLVALSNDPKDPAILAGNAHGGAGWFKYVTLVGGLGASGFALNFLLERSRASIAPYHDREVFLGLAGGMFLVFVSATAVVFRRLFPPPPYQTGEWALTSHLMKLVPGWVVLFPLNQQGKPTIVTVLRNGSYSGSRLQLDGGFTFHFGSKASVDQACGRILAAREAYAKALETKDARALAQLDIFSECTLSGSWTSPSSLDANDGPRSREVPSAAVAGQWLGSLAGGAAVAIAAFMIFSAIHRQGG